MIPIPCRKLACSTKHRIHHLINYIYIHMFHLSPPQMIGCMQSFHVMPSYQQTYQAHVSNLPSNQPHDPLGIFQMIVTILRLLGVLHPGRLLPQNLTWNLKMMVSKRNHLFQGLLFRFHVKFQGCNGWNLQITHVDIDLPNLHDSVPC